MSVATKTWGVFLAGALLVGTYAVYELPRRQPRTTMVMPKAKRQAPKSDGRTYAVIQACSVPQQGTKMALHYTIGPLDAVDAASDVFCAEPYTRKGLVRTGDVVLLGWAINTAGSFRSLRYRFTVNNQVVMEAEAPSPTGQVIYRVTGFESG